MSSKRSGVPPRRSPPFFVPIAAGAAASVVLFALVRRLEPGTASWIVLGAGLIVSVVCLLLNFGLFHYLRNLDR